MTQRISKIETLGPRRAAGGCSWPDPGAGLPRPQITGGRAAPVHRRLRAMNAVPAETVNSRVGEIREHATT